MTAGSSSVRPLIALLILSLLVTSYTWIQNTRLKKEISRLTASLNTGTAARSSSSSTLASTDGYPAGDPPLILTGTNTGPRTSPGPEQGMKEPPPTWLAAFDRAMDEEFRRLDAREQNPRDEAELQMIRMMKGNLLKLDELYAELDATPPGPRRHELQNQTQALMGDIIRMSRADRNQRLSVLASELGIENEEDIARWIKAVDDIYAESDMDWPGLFSRRP